MYVNVRAAPDVDFVVHVIKMTRCVTEVGDGTCSAAKSLSQSFGGVRDPIHAVQTISRRAGLGVIVEQRKIGIRRISRKLGAAVGFKTIARISIKLINFAL